MQIELFVKIIKQIISSTLENKTTISSLYSKNKFLVLTRHSLFSVHNSSLIMITIFEALEKMKAIPEGIKKPKIIIVDDDLSFTTMLGDFLYDECKMRMDVYTNGESFLEDFTAEDFRIIILDYYFDSNSNLTGIDILKAIKQKNKFAVVMMVSGQDDLEIAIETIRNGATDYFYKGNKTVFANIVSSIVKLVELQKQQFN